MIPKGLKVGDTFNDGGMTYKVTGVKGDRYESVWTGAISSNSLFIEQPITQEQPKEDYLSMPYAQLKKLCAQKGIDATGTKSELIARLEG